MKSGPMTRSFLACWPDPSITDALQRAAADARGRVGGRVIRAQNMHVTLAFLGLLTSPQLSAVQACCEPLPARFHLSLDRIGFWKNRGIVWAGARSPDPGLGAFAEDLRDRLRRVGFRVDSRPFVPHVTLLRKAERRPRIEFRSLDWEIGEYTLVASEQTAEGAHYSVLKRWSTQGDVK